MQGKTRKRIRQIDEAFDHLKSKALIHSQQDVADIMGVPKEIVSLMANGAPKGYNSNRIAAFNAAFGGIFNEEYLLGGEGTLLKQEIPTIVPTYYEVSPVPEDNYFMVEYADLRASAGLLGGGDVSQLPDTHRRLLPREYEKGSYLVVRVDGDSMYDGTARSLSDGEEVLIKDVTHQLREGLPIRNSLFVITSREGNVLKQITEINHQEGYLTCHSFNSNYRDYRIPLEDIFQIFLVCKTVARQIKV